MLKLTCTSDEIPNVTYYDARDIHRGLEHLFDTLNPYQTPTEVLDVADIQIGVTRGKGVARARFELPGSDSGYLRLQRGEELKWRLILTLNPRHIWDEDMMVQLGYAGAEVLPAAVKAEVFAAIFGAMPSLLRTARDDVWTQAVREFGTTRPSHRSWEPPHDAVVAYCRHHTEGIEVRVHKNSPKGSARLKSIIAAERRIERNQGRLDRANQEIAQLTQKLQEQLEIRDSTTEKMRLDRLRLKRAKEEGDE